MLHFLSVPPSKRQAAGPLTENLPNVCLVNELAVLTDRSRCLATRTSREPSLHQGTLSRLSSRVVCPGRHRTNGRELEKGFLLAYLPRASSESFGVSGFVLTNPEK